MPSRALIGLLTASLGLWLGCLDALYFDCSDDAQCDLGGQSGVCVQGEGECAYPDDACQSGLAYPPQARPPLAGLCVGDEPGGSSGGGSATVATTTTGPTTGVDTLDGTGSTSSETGDTTDTGETDNPACHVEKIEAGEQHTCLLTYAGDVWCWGTNDFLELGSVGPGGPQPVLVEALESHPVSDISLVHEHTCAYVEDDLSAFCWGQQSQGEIEIGGGGTSVLPTQIEYGEIQQIITSALATCSRGPSSVTCFGQSTWGQTGVEPDTGINPETPLVALDNAFVHGGNRHYCAAVTEQGGMTGVKCWGLNEMGQLGDPSVTENSHIPIDVVGLPGRVDLGGVAVGEQHSCVLIDTETWCWGSDDDNQRLGQGTSATPQHLDMVPPANAIRSGQSQLCVRTLANEWRCWGNNQYGQINPLQDQNNSGLIDPEERVTAVLGPAVEFEVIGMGRDHTCGASDATGIYCWGRDDEGGMLGEIEIGRVGRVNLPGCP